MTPRKGLLTLVACCTLALGACSSDDNPTAEHAGGSETSAATESQATDTNVSAEEQTSGEAGAPSSSSAAAPNSDIPDGAILRSTDPRFDEILWESDYCSPKIKNFARDYEGKTVYFLGGVMRIEPSLSDPSKEDIAFTTGLGDPKNSISGPVFVAQGSNDAEFLKLEGDGVSDKLSEGDRINVAGKIVGYEEQLCYIYIEPVQITSAGI